jgi:hypothetical protein
MEIGTKLLNMFVKDVKKDFKLGTGEVELNFVLTNVKRNIEQKKILRLKNVTTVTKNLELKTAL